MVDKKSTLNKYLYAIVLGSATFVASIVLLLFVVRPLYILSTNVTKEAETKQKNLDYLEDKKATLESLKDKEEELKKSADTVAAALPETTDPGRLFIQLDSLAKAVGGTIKSVGQGGEVAGSSVGPVNVVTYSAPISVPNYFALKQFIEKADKALRLVKIGNLNISSASGSIDTSLSITTYTR